MTMNGYLNYTMHSNMTDFVVVDALGSSRVDDWFLRYDWFSINGVVKDIISQVYYGTINWSCIAEMSTLKLP